MIGLDWLRVTHGEHGHRRHPPRPFAGEASARRYAKPSASIGADSRIAAFVRLRRPGAGGALLAKRRWLVHDVSWISLPRSSAGLLLHALAMKASSLTPFADAWIGHLLASGVDHAIVFLSPEGIIEGWYGAAERLFGHSATDVLGQAFSILFTPQDVALGIDRQEIALARAAGRSEHDRWHLRRNGQLVWTSGVVTALCAEDGRVVGLCKIVRDRTDQRAQVELLEHRVSARDAELGRLKTLLASTVHELRNPLGPIGMALDLLKRELPAETRRRAITALDKQLALLTALVEGLSQGIEPTAAEVRIQHERVNLNDALRLLVDDQEPQATAAQVQLLLVLPSADVHVHADPRRLHQMLLNLIGNALKYTPAGGHVHVSATIEADMAVTRIEDDGVGIAPDLLPHIFELFTRERRDPHIRGLGLAAVQQLAELHGGSVEVRSPGPGQGSIFGLRLPLARSEALPGP